MCAVRRGDVDCALHANKPRDPGCDGQCRCDDRTPWRSRKTFLLSRLQC